MAWSESSELREVFFLTKYLEKQGWIEKNRSTGPEIGYACQSMDTDTSMIRLQQSIRLRHLSLFGSMTR